MSTATRSTWGPRPARQARGKAYKAVNAAMGHTYWEISQMDAYARMYNELRKAPDDNLTLGIALRAEADRDVARYSILSGSEQLFAAKYLTHLAAQEQLKHEIEMQG